MKEEGYDQYQVLIDGSRRLTRRNRKFLKPFTLFKPGMSGPTYQEPAYQTLPQVPTPQPTQRSQTRPAQSSEVQLSPVKPSGVQSRPAQLSGASRDVAEGAQQYGGGSHQPLSTYPESGTVRDQVDGTIPTRVEPVGQPPVTITPTSVLTPAPRRSTRAGRGQTKKYEDYVQNISFRHNYEQV